MGRWRAYAHSILADFHPSSMGEGLSCGGRGLRAWRLFQKIDWCKRELDGSPFITIILPEPFSRPNLNSHRRHNALDPNEVRSFHTVTGLRHALPVTSYSSWSVLQSVGSGPRLNTKASYKSPGCLIENLTTISLHNPHASRSSRVLSRRCCPGIMPAMAIRDQKMNTRRRIQYLRIGTHKPSQVYIIPQSNANGLANADSNPGRRLLPSAGDGSFSFVLHSL
jgi:hypothetical protein